MYDEVGPIQIPVCRWLAVFSLPPDPNPIHKSITLMMEIVELKVEMVAIHEKRLRKCLSKLKGIEKVEVEVGNQKVLVTGCVHKNKILKAVRRSGMKADFWSARNEILVNACASGSLRIYNFSFFGRLS